MIEAAPAITESDLKKCHFDLACHINMGSRGHSYTFRCREHPRLTVAKFSQRKTRTVETTFYVDGEACASLADVAQRLGSPAP